MWYNVRGTGGELNVNTCGGDTNFDTILSVFVGSCGDLQCIASNDDSCSFSSSATWSSELGVEYKVLIYGWSSSYGSFSLTVSSSSSVRAIAVPGTSRVGEMHSGAPRLDSFASETEEGSMGGGEPCEDGPGLFDVSDRIGKKDCPWLSLREVWIDELCNPGFEAFDECMAVCGRCP